MEKSSRRTFLKSGLVLAGGVVASGLLKPFNAVVVAGDKPKGEGPWWGIGIDIEKCIGCGRCYKVCGREVMTLKGINEDGDVVELDDDEDDEVEKKVMVMADTGACIGCGACARVCPANCQTHGGEAVAA